MITRLAVLVACVLLVGCGKPNEPVSSDDKPQAAGAKHPPLDGRWKVVKTEMFGEDLPPDSAGIREMEFSGERVTLTEVWGGKAEKVEHTLKLDPTKTPMVMDIGGVGTGKNCIYKFEGDKLVVALVTKQSGQSPTEFKTTKTTNFLLFTLERAK